MKGGEDEIEATAGIGFKEVKKHEKEEENEHSETE